MKNTALIPLAAMLLVGCATDNDGDGFAVEDDCNDENADVYPDAEETIGDGIDSNCDGEDPNFDYVGDWDLKSMLFQFDDDGEIYDLLQYYPDGSGTFSVTPELYGRLATSHTFTDEDGTAGYDLLLFGDVSPMADVARFSMDLTGYFAEPDDLSNQLSLDGDWECTVAAEELSCAGAVIYDDLELDLSAVFTGN